MGVQRKWEAHGLKCRVLDSPFQGYNGYVGIPKEHPAWRKNYNDLPIDVHGGLTFSEMGKEDDANWPDPELCWFGFDTAHSGDWVGYSPERGGRRWTVASVADETENMARQFAEMDRKVFLDYGARHTIQEFYGEDFLNKLLRGELRGLTSKAIEK